MKVSQLNPLRKSWPINVSAMWKLAQVTWTARQNDTTVYPVRILKVVWGEIMKDKKMKIVRDVVKHASETLAAASQN